MVDFCSFSLIFKIIFGDLKKIINLCINKIDFLESKKTTIMAASNIIGREIEIETLERIYKSQKSEFIAIYGRRRIGKSFLVNEVYKDKIVF